MLTNQREPQKMKDFLARNWFTLVIAAFIGLGVVNNVFPPPEPERSQPEWPPTPRRGQMMTGPCTEWRSTLVTLEPEPTPPLGQAFVEAIAGQFGQAAIIGESDPSEGGRISREALGIGIKVEFIPAGTSGRGYLEATLYDLCRLVLLDHSTELVAEGVSPSAAAAAVRSNLNRLLPPSYRAPVVEVTGYGPLEGAPAELATAFRSQIRNLAAAESDILYRETELVKLRLSGSGKAEPPTAPPVAVIRLSVRTGRNGEKFVAWLDRESPQPGSETLEAESAGQLAIDVMDRFRRLAWAQQ